jgi:malate synthase
MKGPNQLSKIPEHIPGRDEMLEMHRGARTEEGARHNIRVGVQYLAAWLGGRGAVPLYNLMEDAATAEISRAQLWQWLHFEAELDDGRTFDRALFGRLFDEELAKLQDVPDIDEAADLFRDMIVSDEFVEFLTLPAYELLG